MRKHKQVDLCLDLGVSKLCITVELLTMEKKRSHSKREQKAKGTEPNLRSCATSQYALNFEIYT